MTKRAKPGNGNSPDSGIEQVPEPQSISILRCQQCGMEFELFKDTYLKGKYYCKGDQSTNPYRHNLSLVTIVSKLETTKVPQRDDEAKLVKVMVAENVILVRHGMREYPCSSPEELWTKLQAVAQAKAPGIESPEEFLARGGFISQVDVTDPTLRKIDCREARINKKIQLDLNSDFLRETVAKMLAEIKQG